MNENGGVDDYNVKTTLAQTRSNHFSYFKNVLAVFTKRYGGLIDVLRPNKGETLFVSAAAGDRH